MRLPKVHQPSGVPGLVMRFAKSIGQAPYDVVQMLMYRRDFLAKRLNPLCQEIMRGPSSWTIGERELFAAFVSQTTRCRF